MNKSGELDGCDVNEVDKLLEEIVEELGLLYISDVHIQKNKELAVQYINDHNIYKKDKKLYDDIMRYLTQTL